MALKRNAGRIAIPFLLLLFWWLLYWAVGEPEMASPTQTFQNLFENWGRWWPHFVVSLKLLFISLLLIMIGGIAVGTAIGLSSHWFQILNPIIMAIYSIPKITIYPIFLLVFGINDAGKIAFTVFHGIFPVIITCMEATQIVPKIFVKVGDTYRLSFYKKLRYIILPAILPQLVSGLRLGFSLGFLGLILLEMFASFEGIGNLLHHYMSLNRVSSILALFLVASLVSLLFALLFILWQERIERKTGKLESMKI